MIFTRVFYNFLIVLKFSQVTSYKNNLTVHLFKYVSCIMFISIYVVEQNIIMNYSFVKDTIKYLLAQKNISQYKKIIIPEYPPVLKCFEHTYRCIKCKDFVTHTFLRPHPCFAPSKIKLQSKLCLLLLLEMYRSMKLIYMSIHWSLSMPTVELCLQESFHKQKPEQVVSAKILHGRLTI